MTDQRAEPMLGGIGLLERAINYTLGSLHLATPEDLSHRTPCREWDLRALLMHMDDSLDALQDAADVGHVDLDAAEQEGDPAVDPVARVRNRACQLLGAWANAGGLDVISIAGRALTTSIVTCAGALEVAVHGWDVARACGRHHPIPALLAEEMFELSPLFVTDADRPGRFAAPIVVASPASPSDRLVAFLGRHPY